MVLWKNGIVRNVTVSEEQTALNFCFFRRFLFVVFLHRSRGNILIGLVVNCLHLLLVKAIAVYSFHIHISDIHSIHLNIRHYIVRLIPYLVLSIESYAWRYLFSLNSKYTITAIIPNTFDGSFQ